MILVVEGEKSGQRLNWIKEISKHQVEITKLAVEGLDDLSEKVRLGEAK